MIDFQNGSVFKLRKTGKFSNEKTIAPLFVSGEEFIGEYQAVRDYVIFTNKRVIAVNVQGVTGKKRILPPFLIPKFSCFPWKLPAYWIWTVNWICTTAGWAL